MAGDLVNKRLFLGCLNGDVSSDEIHERFSRFGRVSNLSITRRTDIEGNQIKSFAHLDIEGDEANIKKCFSTYQNTKWKGSVLKLQYAKESFLTKLEKEREEPIQNQILKSQKVTPGESDLAKSMPKMLEVKGSAVPGAPVPGKTDWVIGKYGRVLPVLKLKKSYKLKMVKHDPSKYCHAAKVFKADKASELTSASCDELTWEIDTPDSEITKKIKGQFPETSHSGKKRKRELLYFNAQIKSFGVGYSHQLDQSLNNKLRSLETERDSGEFEIVKSGAVNEAWTVATTQDRNRFDSDVDSESEVVHSILFTVPTREKEKSVLSKKVQMPTHQGSKEKSFSDTMSQKSASGQQTSTTNHRVNGLESEERVPKFKGLQMLGLASKKSDRMPDSRRQVQNSTLEKSLQSATRTSSYKNIRCTNDIVVNIKPGDNKPDTASDEIKSIPEFRGLSLLSGPSHTEDRSSQCRTVRTDDTQQPSAKKQKQTSSYVFSGETMKKSLSANQRISVPSRETKKEPMSHSASAHLLVASKEKNMEGYDSASSADTDEILSRYKSKHGISLSSPMSSLPTPSADPSSIHQSDRNLSQTPNGSGMSRTSSLLDKSLYLSEITAGTPELYGVSPRYSTPAHMIQKRPYDGSSDSELDSNDFELVAKKLTEKAARTSKFRNVNCLLSRDRTFRNEPLSMKVDRSENFINSRQGRTETDIDNSQEGANKKSSLQKKLMDIAKGYDTSAAPASLLQQAENLDEKTETKKRKLSNKDSLVNKSERDEISEKGKHFADNEKRLQAVKEHLRQKQQQQNLMRKALHSVDAQQNNTSKRIVFSSGEDDTTYENSDNDDISHGVTGQDKPIADPGGQKQKHSNRKGKLMLLENSSEDEEESDYEEMFKSKPHFEGTKGERLMKLERKFGDSRFKLDAKFAESDSEEDKETKSNEEVPEKKVYADLNLEEEKAASLRVLENVIGKTTLDKFSEKIKRNTKFLIDMNAVRFDPTKVVSQAKLASSAEDKKVMAKVEVSPTSNKYIKKTELEKRQTENEKHSEDEQRKKTQGNEKDMLRTDKEKAGAIVDGLKGKLVKKSQKHSTEHEEEKSNASLDGKSKVHLASSLVDLFKKRQDNEEEEEPQSFSLLKQFDAGDEEESDNSSVDEDALNDSPIKAVLSGLLKKAEPQKKAVTMDGDTPNIFDTTAVTSPVASFGEHSDSDGGDSEEEDGESGGRKTGFLRAFSEEETSEDSEEGQSVAMDDGLPSALQDEDLDSGKELANAGRVDVRYTRDQWLQRWEEIRPVLVKMYKRKHKDALKNKRAQSQIKRKREFLNKSRKGNAAHRTR